MPTHALIIRGHQGTGKSTLAQELSQSHSFCMLSKDTIYLPTIEVVQDHQTASHIAYNAIRAILLANRDSGLSFVVDAPFHNIQDVENLTSTCTAAAITIKSILLVCNDRQVWQSRLADRRDDLAANHQITDLLTLRAVRGSLASVALANELIIDTTDPGHTPNDLANICRQHLMGSPLEPFDQPVIQQMS